MSHYRKKPVVIEASEPVTQDTVNEVARWIQANGGRAVPVTGGVQIPTLEGDMLAAIGDRVIRGIKGEFYPCKPDIFAATYEPVASPPESGIGESMNSERIGPSFVCVVHGPRYDVGGGCAECRENVETLQATKKSGTEPRE